VFCKTRSNRYTNLPGVGDDGLLADQAATEQETEESSEAEEPSDSATDTKVKPIPWVNAVTSTGMITVRFSQSMSPIANLTEFRYMNVTINGTVYPAMEVKIIEGQDSLPEQLKFNYTIVSQTEKDLLIKLTFEQP